VDVCVLGALSHPVLLLAAYFFFGASSTACAVVETVHISVQDGGGSAPPIVRGGWIIFLRTHVMPETRVYGGPSLWARDFKILNMLCKLRSLLDYTIVAHSVRLSFIIFTALAFFADIPPQSNSAHVSNQQKKLLKKNIKHV
jgi:hypothetical protein